MTSITQRLRAAANRGQAVPSLMWEAAEFIDELEVQVRELSEQLDDAWVACKESSDMAEM